MVFELVSRLEWEALPPKGPLEKMEHPVGYVSVSYVTTESEIAPVDAIRHLQQRDMLKGMSDIQSNFYIAKDGVVYEGRGWHLQPGNKNDHPGKEGKFLEFTYLGDFSQEELNHPVYISTGLLLDIGVKNEFVMKAAIFLTETPLIGSNDPNRQIIGRDSS